MSYGVNERRSCRVLRLHRGTCRYQSVRDDRTVLRIRLRDLATTWVGYGYRRLHILLRREGWEVNHKLVYRLYLEEGLRIRRKGPRRRHRSGVMREPCREVHRANQRWTMDFMSDQLYDGRRFRLLTVVDSYTRECLAIRVGRRMTGKEVVSTLEQLSVRTAPWTIRRQRSLQGPWRTSQRTDIYADPNIPSGTRLGAGAGLLRLS